MGNDLLILIAIGAVLFLFFLKQVLSAKAPLRAGFAGMLCGVAALTAVNILGFAIAVNLFSVLISLTLGIPGVVMILILTNLI